MKSLISIVAIIVTLSFPEPVPAQEITGTVIDQSTRKPLEFVNVLLRKAADSSMVAGAVTAKDGTFAIPNIPPGDYFLRFSIMGYLRKTVSAVRIGQTSGTIVVGTIQLKQTTVDLKEVVVTGEKPLFSQEIDRKVYNVEKDVAAASGSASDLLRNIPSVEVDIEGNVSLRGSSDVLILINGKNSPLMGENRAEVLQQMPANSIERIEVITNPSARYRPDGTSGIINIALKKEGGQGLNASVTANGGEEGRYGGNLRLNYRPGETNLFGSYSLRRDKRNRSNSDVRVQDQGMPAMNTYRQEGTSSASPRSHMGMLGVEHEFNRSTTGAISGNYFVNRMTMSDRTGITRGEGGITSLSERATGEESSEEETGLKASLEHKFPEEDHQIQIEVQTSRESEEERTDARSDFAAPGSLAELEKVRNLQKQRSTEVTADYLKPVGEGSRLEAGYYAEFSTYDFDASAESFDNGAGRYVVDAPQTNRFLQDEALHAVYATYRQSFGPLGMMAGLRGEKVFRTSNLVTLGTEVRSGYAALYPTLHLTYRAAEAVELQLNYSRRTHRPHAHQLNPFPEYRDPRNVSIGNPYLLPEYTHSLELGCKLETELFNFLPGMYYRYTDNRFTEVVRPLNDSTLLATEENLANDRSAGLEAILSGGVQNLFTVNASANGFYNIIDAGNLGYESTKSVWSWGGSMTCNVHLTSSTMLQMNANYRSARLTPQGSYSPSGVVNVGFRQDLWSRKVTLVFTVADLFRTMRRELTLDTPALTQRVVSTRDSRVFALSITFRFGTEQEEKEDDPLRYDNALE
jgi:outer membrane receptor protein involved in Fe transport